MLVPVIDLSILLVLTPANVLRAVDHNFENSLLADLWNSVIIIIIVVVIIIITNALCVLTHLF
jgi:hypothetical protein